MGDFAKAVQNGVILGPLRRGFKSKSWDSEHKRIGNDAHDESLHRAGVLIHAKAESIRAALKFTFSKNHNATTRLRSFIAVANYTSCVLEVRANDAIAAMSQGDTIMQPDIASMKLPLPSGGQYRPDEIAQSLVDGADVAIKVILESSPELKGNPHFADVDWDEVKLDFSFGGLYCQLNDLWDDCLWNEYAVSEVDQGWCFYPRDSFWQSREAASNFRYDNLHAHFSLYAQMAHKEMTYPDSDIMMRDVRGITKNGRRQSIQLTTLARPTEDAWRLIAARAYASEPYYSELLSEPQKLILNASLNDLMNGWAIVSRTVIVLLRERMELTSTMNDLDPVSWLPKFAPILQIEALTRAIESACNLEYAQASAIIEFLTFRGASGQDLWAQPLIPVNTNCISPMFGSAIAPNLRRLVDVWMRQLGVDLGRRGEAFEGYIRSELAAYIKASPLLKGSQLMPTGLNFRPLTDCEEQIDVVFVVGDIVVLGEAKCALKPAEAKQYAMHRKTVMDAVSQIQRKAEVVKKNAAAFRERLRALGIELPEVFKVLPIVILNDATHAGFEVCNVPIVDRHILDIFFRGELVDVATTTKGGGMRNLSKRKFYATPSEAAVGLESFLKAPPQMEAFIAGITERQVPIPGISEQDWSGSYLTFECVVKDEHLRRVGSIAR